MLKTRSPLINAPACEWSACPGLWSLRGCSSVGRALQWHCRGQRFDPAQLHHALATDGRGFGTGLIIGRLLCLEEKCGTALLDPPQLHQNKCRFWLMATHGALQSAGSRDMSSDLGSGEYPRAVSGEVRRDCPECYTPATRRYSPFCSKRCADVDLHRWLSESYRVPSNESEETPNEP